ncbi:hypothetical protein E3N88_29078 [Mikania micrantha]|uniref:C3H1-type domain-containing protein n=1 Tax=Mikania micrantha TaxID=192012 RepID=A0A5N6N2H2_9ASTR|nr:hypothetical protein E3N88_29078 [Mikania micrantha]
MMEKLEIQTGKEIPKSKTSPLFGNCRRRPIRSHTVDTLHRILSLCYDDSSDKGKQMDVPSNCTDRMPNYSIFQEQASMDETRVVLDAQEDGLYNKRVESSEHDHNILGETKDLPQIVNFNPSTIFDISSQDKSEMICASPYLATNENVEEGEISGHFVDHTKTVGEADSETQDSISTEMGLKNDNKLIPLFTEAVENGGKDVAGVVTRNTRNLVDYSEIAVQAKSQESAKQANLKINKTKSQNLVFQNSSTQNNRKRKGFGTEEKRMKKKLKKSVNPENLTLLCKHLADASLDVDASANKAACTEKKTKRVVTKERKAKKKMKDRIKRAEKNRKLGIRRLKLQPVIKEKKIIYCRHYMNGRCHEGEKCKFSHDTIPLTKSKPCCHFARHTCMKGDDCPYDHQLSKYPCNNYQTKGSCNRGSDCMFSHEAQLSESSLNVSKPEQKHSSNSNSKQIETKSCSVPKFVDITPKSIRPPKGINFFSQGKLSLPSPKIDCESKEITKMPLQFQDSKEKTTMPSLVQASAEISKTPTILPRGINFLSFGKKPGLDYSSSRYSFRISSGVVKSRSSDIVGEGLKPGPSVKVVNEAKVDFPTDRSNSLKTPIHLMSFMSSTSQKALQSTLAFASELDSGVKSKV